MHSALSAAPAWGPDTLTTATPHFPAPLDSAYTVEPGIKAPGAVGMVPSALLVGRLAGKSAGTSSWLTDSRWCTRSRMDGIARNGLHGTARRHMETR